MPSGTGTSDAGSQATSVDSAALCDPYNDTPPARAMLPIVLLLVLVLVARGGGPRGDTTQATLLAATALPEPSGQRLSHNDTATPACESTTCRIEVRTAAAAAAAAAAASTGVPTLTGSANRAYGGRDVLGVGDCEADCVGVPVCDGLPEGDAVLNCDGVCV